MNRKISCHICQVDDTRTLWEEEPYRVVQCQRCNLIYQNPQPDELELDKIYGKDYFTNNYLRYEKERTDYFHNIWSDIEKIVGYSGCLLDIGCGIGLFLKVASQSSWETYGIEPSTFASTYARETYGHRVITGDLDEVDFSEESFDIITMWDVIAHIPTHTQYLKKIHKWLKEEGFLIIKTPNWKPTVFRLASLLCLFFTYHNLLHLKHQLTYFNYNTLEALLTITGYQMVYTKYVEEVKKERQDRITFKELGKKSIELAIKLLNKAESLICLAKKQNK